MKKIIRFLLPALLAAACLAQPALAAQSTTYTWAIDRRGNFVHTQDAYLPDRTVTDLMLREPEDIFIAGNGMLYVSDTGNRRILVYDIARGAVARELAYEGFQKPRGLYVTPALDLYVADSAAGAVFRFDRDGNLIQTFTRPDSAAFGDTAYAPARVAVDGRGSVYLVGEGVANGIIQLSVTGEFLGFFTTNKVTLTWIQAIQNLIFTDAQKSQLQAFMPGTFSNLYADARGILYTVTMGRMKPDNVKKHDMKGGNIFKNGVISSNSLSDVTTDRNGIIYAGDSRGWVMVFSPDGDFIFDFGGYSADDVAGLYAYLTAVAVEEDGTVWTLDNEKAYLQSYKPTEYTLSIYQALTLFNQGRYSEAEAMWDNVLRYNQTSILAHDGIGKAGLYLQKYDDARLHFELSGNRAFYSQAFWETRNAWLQKNLIWLLGAIALLAVLFNAVKLLDRRKAVRAVAGGAARRVREAPVVRDFVFAASIMRHPLDGYYDLKRNIRGTYKGAALQIAALFVSMILYQTSKAYIVQTTAIEDMNLAATVGGFFGVIALFIVCNYLVTSINDGEGSIGDIFKMTAYASLPLTLSFTLITALSYALTFNEVFLLNFLMTAGVAWFCLTLYLGLQEMHNYNVWNTVKSILFTAGFILIALIALLILTILFQQMAQFIEALGREVYYNAAGII
ncbi:MAG: YIP1 family protein [Oscillospiraceae bacterium]|nr:YIP1 family protein [Oscillospiraceae bacterium]